VECPRCHRKFAEEAAQRHIRSCRKGEGPRNGW
jgi:hypothetical protein